MKKAGKIILIIVVLLVSTVFIDFISLNTINKPFFAIKVSESKYSGLLFDTYLCEEFSWFTFKPKFNKFACALDVIEIKPTEKEYIVESIQDESIGRTDLVFAQALEKFYEDENFEYFYSCIKSSYVTVTYTNGEKETVKDALANNRITMSDVNRFGIKYYKERK